MGRSSVVPFPEVWVWKRSMRLEGFWAPKRSFMIVAQSRRAARNFATSSRKFGLLTKKKESRGAKASTSSPARIAAST